MLKNLKIALLGGMLVLSFSSAANAICSCTTQNAACYVSVAGYSCSDTPVNGICRNGVCVTSVKANK